MEEFLLVDILNAQGETSHQTNKQSVISTNLLRHASYNSSEHTGINLSNTVITLYSTRCFDRVKNKYEVLLDA